MQNNHRVTLESKDNHVYIYNCNTETKRDAAVMAKQAILDKGWETYDYIIVNTEFLDTEEVTMEISVASDVVGILKGE